MDGIGPPKSRKFHGLTGFKRRMRQLAKEDEQLAGGIEAFLTIGTERNRMVHTDFASYPLDKTADEVMDLYRRAVVFVEELPVLLQTYGSVEDD